VGNVRRAPAFLAAVLVLAGAPPALAAPSLHVGRTHAGFFVQADGITAGASLPVSLVVRDPTGWAAVRQKVTLTPAAPKVTIGLGGVPNGEYRLTAIGAAPAVSNWLEVRRAGRTHVIRSAPRAGRRVALTFDDGLDPKAAMTIFATLRSFNAPATLFFNRVSYERHRQLIRPVRRLLATGLVTLGNHTATHHRLTTLGPAGIRSELERDRAFVHKTFHRSNVPFFRPPYGASNPTVLSIAGELGYTTTVLWSVDPSDYRGLPAATVVANVGRELSPGGIVLMHVDPSTASALPSVIRLIRHRGYTIVPLGTLLRRGRG
jgi:peptidoglycan/xylan/chitin deacetylase (PgdA/CDA1 family)